ncbi:hypothetical protein CY35_02G119400 [Sphagnum magellanicum]|nr:hypothetical protein CY35_02G119400 [Sphagnum magellanicum]
MRAPALQKVTDLCHFLPSCRDGKWLCRCKQHDLFAANTYQFFVKFPSLRESNCAVSVCACAVNALKALYTGWGILRAMGEKECPDPCVCGWEGVICVELVQPAGQPGLCFTYSVIGLELVGLGLRGHLSGAIGNLTNLQSLTITGNPGLTGNLPSEIGSLTNLTVLDLHDNNFTGVIPNLAQLANLTVLFLNGNAFCGSIERVFQGLNTPIELDLSSNQLTGCIPGLTTGLGNWSSFPAIQYL